MITLNVGGTKFTTTRETLCKFPATMIGTMFGKNLSMEPSNLKDDNGNIFIDRNPDIFTEILDMCREGKMESNPNKKLKKEMKYWFSMTTQKSQHELEAKKISENIYKVWKNHEGIHHIEYRVPLIRHSYVKNLDMSNEYFKKELLDSRKKCNKIADCYGMSLADFCVWSNLTKEQCDKIVSLVEKNDDDFHDAINVVEGDPKLFQRVKTMWCEMSEYYHEYLSKPHVLDLVCKNLEKTIGLPYRVVWYMRSHVCGTVGSTKWESKELESSFAISSGEAYVSNICFFPNITRFEHALSVETEFVDCSCQCGESRATYDRCRSPYICIYQAHEHFQPDKEKKEFRSINDGIGRIKDEIENIALAIMDNTNRIIYSNDAISESIRDIELDQVSQELSNLRSFLKRKYDD